LVAPALTGLGRNLSPPADTLAAGQPGGAAMLIDCEECAMQDTIACRDCVVSHLLRDVVGPIEVDEEQVEALEVLAEAGLVPTLRLLPRSAAG